MEAWIAAYPEDSLARRAYAFAEKAHEGVKRANGDPYISHPIAVAETVHAWNLDEASIAAAFLHDVVEDTDITVKDIAERFGEEVAELVDGVTKLKHFQYGANPDAENMRKLVLSFGRDLRVILVKLADRYHNMRTLQFKSPEKQREIAWETIEIYAPIAYRLGIQKLSGELEDLAFPFLYREEYKWLLENVKERYEEREEYAERIKPTLREMLVEGGVRPIAVDSRAKRYYSLYKKLLRHDMDLEKIYDLVAIRVIVGTIEECYATLGVIHKHWAPLQGRFKDFIATPKPNGYRSLHTTVFCVDNKITEIQIKTKEMHEENEFGIAAHWAYEQEKKRNAAAKHVWQGVTSKKELVWVRQLQNWQEKFSSHEDFLDALKVDFFKDRIFVITPAGDVIDLPDGATPVDFAYRIHSEIGDECVGAKVNGKFVPLDSELHSGDHVEILTQHGKKPSEDWLRFIKSPSAKKYVKNALHKRGVRFRKRVAPPSLEFRVVCKDHPGYLKELGGIFGDAKVNITYLKSETDQREAFSTITFRSGNIPKPKLEKLITKVKMIADTSEISYRYLSA